MRGGSKNTQSWCGKRGVSSSKVYHHPSLNPRHAVTIVDNEFQSQPCLAICYTCDETLEQSSCCDMDASNQTHTNLGVEKWGVPVKVYHHLSLNSQHAFTIVDNEFQSQPCLAICNTCNEMSEQSSCCGMDASNQTHTHTWCGKWEVGGTTVKVYPHLSLNLSKGCRAK